ncbi:MAG TPA: class I adenylate-forming enzyme family protein [Methyloceanibacter sp.]|nr:class I adenylate-forming enzyme family protein [Methyloceanibacter sp.]
MHCGPSLDKPIQLPDLLEAGLKTRPEEIAIVSLEDRWSWSELAERTERLAAHYLALGLEPGDRVASLMPNRLPLIAHYLACFKAGLVMTPLNYRYTPPEIDHALEVSGAKIILAHAERRADIAASKARALPLGVISYQAEKEGGPHFEHLMETTPPSVAFPGLDPEAPAAIFFTSGSTGPAKGVTHTHASLGWMFASVAKGYALTQDDVMLPASSCSHIGGFSFAMAALSVGARLAVARVFDHAELGPLVRVVRPTVMTTLPATLLHLIREPDTTAEDFASLRLCRSGGDKVSAELEKEFHALTGHIIHEGYGMTEIGIAANNPPYGVDKIGSIGLPNPGFVFSIRSEEGKETRNGREGRVFVRAPSHTSGYWNAPEATAEVFQDGWFDTGDVMKADSDGYLWFCGRKKQIIVHDGSNISPLEVEDALLDHPAVESVGVIGIHDAAHGENVRAYVELKQGKAATAGELIAFARERVGYKAPEDVVFLDTMPLNPTGKVDRAKLKKMAAGDHAHHV